MNIFGKELAMKRILMLAILSAAFLGAAEAKPRFEPPVDVGFFYSSLSPYGEWVNVSFGTAWRPLHVEHGWRPYMYGQWVWTDYGWYWVSQEPYGWATYHYGRWSYDDYYGWIWIPGDVWGPAWVEWRYDDDYIGWAPLSPYASFDVSIGVTYTDRWVAPVHYWNFVPCRYFTTARVVDYVQPIDRSRRIFGETRGVLDIRSRDNRVVNRGVDVNFVERRTNTRINRVDVVDAGRVGNDRFVRDANHNRIEAYRPRIDGATRGENPSVRDRMNDRTGIDARRSGRDAARQPGDIREQAPQTDRRPDVQRPRDNGRQVQQQPERQRYVPQRPQPQVREQQPRYVPQQPQPRVREQQPRYVPQQPQPQVREQQPRYVPQRPQPQVREQQPRGFQNRENPRVQRQEPQVKQRPQPAQRPEPRGGRDGKRKP